jgi:hypothetical protein
MKIGRKEKFAQPYGFFSALPGPILLLLIPQTLLVLVKKI